MKDNQLFLKRFLESGGKIGSIAPSSPYLVQAILKMLPFSQVKIIVELGAGTGVITEKLLEKKRKKTQVVVLEPDAHFFPLLQEKLQRDESLRIFQEKAETLKTILSSMGFSNADCIISSLPFGSLGKKASELILAELKKALSKEGRFIFYQYTLFTLPWINKYFSIKKASFVPLNLPPAFLFSCVPRA